MQAISTSCHETLSASMAARFRTSFNHHGHHRLRGGNAFSVAAESGAADPACDRGAGGDFGQARRRAAPGAGRPGGDGRGGEYPSIAAPQALLEVFERCALALVMTWPVLAIGLAIAAPPPAGVFAYLTDLRELVRPTG